LWRKSKKKTSVQLLSQHNLLSGEHSSILTLALCRTDEREWQREEFTVVITAYVAPLSNKNRSEYRIFKASSKLHQDYVQQFTDAVLPL
jgi:hypothetical protein